METTGLTTYVQQPSRAAVPLNFRRGGRFTWHQRRRHALVQRLMAGLEGRRVLDYGCGYGDITFALSKTNPVVGIDVDPARVAFARAEYPEIEFREFDGEMAPFPDGSLDVVLSCVVLPFVADYHAHLRDAARLLTTAGTLLLVTTNGSTGGAGHRAPRLPAARLQSATSFAQTPSGAKPPDVARFRNRADGPFLRSAVRQMEISENNLLRPGRPAVVPGASRVGGPYFGYRARNVASKALRVAHCG